jgi:hypothetical protein
MVALAGLLTNALAVEAAVLEPLEKRDKPREAATAVTEPHLALPDQALLVLVAAVAVVVQMLLVLEQVERVAVATVVQAVVRLELPELSIQAVVAVRLQAVQITMVKQAAQAQSLSKSPTTTLPYSLAV